MVAPKRRARAPDDSLTIQFRRIVKGVIAALLGGIAVWLFNGPDWMIIAGAVLSQLANPILIFRDTLIISSRDSLVQNIVRKSVERALGIALGAGILGVSSLICLGHREAVPWILLGCAIWGGLDATLTFRRLTTGDYGDADYELRELIVPLVARIKRGGDPDDPDRLFPERKAEQFVLVAAERQATV